MLSYAVLCCAFQVVCRAVLCCAMPAGFMLLVGVQKMLAEPCSALLQDTVAMQVRP
jgi:hypothetical protein